MLAAAEGLLSDSNYCGEMYTAFAWLKVLVHVRQASLWHDEKTQLLVDHAARALGTTL